MSRDLLGAAHELSVPTSERHARGQYFTPNALIDLVLTLCEGAPRTVLDPACGSGRFLLGARERWGGATLRGFETDPVALSLARANLPAGDLSPESFLTAAPTGDVDLLVGNPPYVRNRGQKRDLYVDFIERAHDWLRPRGRLAFVLSSAWLDVGYGATVRRILREGFAVEWLVESSAERWFPGAKVNTMVLIARREDDPGAREAESVRCGVLAEALPSLPTVRRRVPQHRLSPDVPWGVHLRAPDVWLHHRERLPVLGAFATVRRGFTTNANGFFYPVETDRDGIERRFLRPLLKSPKRVKGLRARAAELPDRVFLCDSPDAPGAAAWIARGGRDGRWTLPAQTPTRLFLPKGYGDRLRSPLFDVPVYCDQQLYQVVARGGVDEEAMAALLNSSWFRLSLELVGRVNFGDGVLWLGLEDARGIPLPDPAGAVDALRDAFAQLPDGPVPPLPTLFDAPDWAAATGAIDAIVGALIGLTPTEQYVVRRAAATLCARRVRKAASARNQGRVERSE